MSNGVGQIDAVGRGSVRAVELGRIDEVGRGDAVGEAMRWARLRPSRGSRRSLVTSGI
jgi:hypothetical protein